MTEADNAGQLDPASQAPAASEPMIPKHRLDEVAARLREKEQELSYKNQLLDQMRPAQAQQAQPEIDFEELGLSKEAGRAVMKVASQISAQQIRQAGAQMQQQMVSLKAEAEEAKFLVQYGTDKAKYLDRIKEKRLEFWKLYGTAMPMDAAYKLVAFDEMQTRPAQRQPAAQGNPAQAQATRAPAETPDSGFPGGEGTRPNAPATARKEFSEDMTPEEMEAYFSSQEGFRI